MFWHLVAAASYVHHFLFCFFRWPFDSATVKLFSKCRWHLVYLAIETGRYCCVVFLFRNCSRDVYCFLLCCWFDHLHLLPISWFVYLSVLRNLYRCSVFLSPYLYSCDAVPLFLPVVIVGGDMSSLCALVLFAVCFPAKGQECYQESIPSWLYVGVYACGMPRGMYVCFLKMPRLFELSSGSVVMQNSK